MEVQELGSGRLLVDLGFRDMEGVIGSYLLPEEEGWALVEVGPTTCRARFLKGLAAAGVSPREVRDVLVTHIHLDHAGALGALAEDLPKARFHAHASGIPHLVDPSRLVASARRAWGPASDELWGPVLPVPADRLVALQGGESIPLKGAATLRVLATPGHARHHVSFLDEGTGSLLTGDGAGVLLPGARHIRPAVPPPDLDIPQFLGSLRVMEATGADRLLFSHYGPAEHARERLHEVAETLSAWVTIATEAARREPTVASVARALEAYERERARREGEPPEFLVRSGTISSLELAAAGLLRYLSRPSAGGHVSP